MKQLLDKHKILTLVLAGVAGGVASLGGYMVVASNQATTIEEKQKREMVKMVEDILTKKSKEGGDVVGKDTTISKILTKNLQSIKKLADKEGISINKLINILKKGE
jgi:hypothetical protein